MRHSSQPLEENASLMLTNQLAASPPLHWRWMRIRLLLAALVLCGPSWGYSVLTHEAVIDSAWNDSIKPLLLKRFPQSTPDDLRRAHGFAYGGAIIQDMGYYPHGSHEFSDLTHYIRSGEFIENLIRESRSLDDYAFALGSLAHYAADDQGHTIAVNVAEPMLYAKVRRKFGPVVTYEDDPADHLKTEFSFDVLQVARGYYAPQAYHNFIGFGVAPDLLDRAFARTYCLHLAAIFQNPATAINSYRRDVSGLIPRATRIAWAMKKKEIEKRSPGMLKRRFIYNISRASFEKEWGRNYDRPNLLDRMLAFILKCIPPIGPLADIRFKTPDAKSESLFMESFDKTLEQYRALLRQVGEGSLHLENLNFDTGKPAAPGAYRLADQAAAKWKQEVPGSCPAQPLRAESSESRSIGNESDNEPAGQGGRKSID
jgi:hypothetical protein